MKKIRSNSIYRRTNRSMQYYRLWIYSCNGVLGITSAIFAIFAAFVLADVRLSLLGGVELYHPTFLYAYTALILQCGVVQTIGCLGAQRLSHKLLSVYWILLLLLTIGDVVVGLVWVFKLDKVKLNLRPVLTSEFISKYSTDESFTKTWNKVQSEEHCCGVDGPLDYDKLSRVAHQQHSKLNPNSSLVIDVESSLLSLPESCCIVIYDSALVGGGSGSRDSVNQTHRSTHHSHAKELPNASHNNRSHFEDNNGNGRDHGGGTFNVSDTPPSSSGTSSVLPWDSEGSGGGSADDYMLDATYHHHVINPSQITDPLLLTESSVSDEEEYFLSNSHIHVSTTTTNSISSNSPFSSIGGVETTSRESNERAASVSLGSESSEDLPSPPLPLQTSLNKHKHRHETHRLKQPSSSSSPSANSSEESSSRPSLGNDTAGELSETEIPFSSKNGSNDRTKNKSKSLPSFSLTPKRLPPSSSRKVPPVVTEEAEVAERLPVPFTCQRHLKIHFHPTQQNIVPLSNDGHDDGSSNASPDSTLTSTISSSSPFLSRGDKLPPSSPTILGASFQASLLPKERERGSTTLENNEIGGGESISDIKEKVKREKSNSESLGSSLSSAPRNKRNVDKSFSNVGLNPFMFLHASAFGSEGNEDEEDDESEIQRNVVRRRKRRGEIGSDMQAAYYLSSSAQYLTRSSTNSSLEKKFQVYRHGCGVKLIQWVDHVSGILFILGFCIIGFVKACFLIILRTEIREMIEKIQMLEIDDPVSPSRAHSKDQRLHHVSHPLLTHPHHRASTVSAHAYNATLLPTIKSPEGISSQPTRFPRSYHQRRHSNIVGDRSQSHSQETVNMTLLVTSNSQAGSPHRVSQMDGAQQTEKGRSNPNLSLCSGGSGTGGGSERVYMGMGRDEFDPTGLSISVPNTSRYLRRSSTCSSSANPGPSYSLFSHYDSDVKPGPSSRFYHYEPHHHPPYHSHCLHHYSRARPHLRNISTGAVVHQSSISGGMGGAGPSGSTGCGPSGISSAFRSFGGESGSLSSRDENEILSASMENVGGGSSSGGAGGGGSAIVDAGAEETKSEEERREAEIRDWAAATACTDNTTTASSITTGSDHGRVSGGVGLVRTCEEPLGTVLSLGDFTKSGFNLSSDSTESSERNQQSSSSTTKRNGNNNMEPPDSIPLSYLGTAV